MGEVLSHLLNFRHLDSSCNRDKVNRAAATAPAPMVFATQLRNLYRDKTPPAHLDGKAKTIYAATQTATKLYRRPLGCNYTFRSHLPACPDRFAALSGQIDYFQTNP